MNNKQYDLLRDIFQSTKYMKIAVPTIVSIAMISSLVDLFTVDQEIKINSGKINVFELFIYIVFKFLIATLIFLNSMFSNKFILMVYRNAIKMFFLEYINMNYLKFISMGVGTIQFSIMKRSNALIKLLQILTLRFLINLIYLIVIVIRLSFYISLNILIKSSALLMGFLTIVLAIQYKRASFRKYINKSMTSNSQKLLDCLLNYERIKSYRNEAIELERYYAVLTNLVFYKQIYEVLYVVLICLISIGFLWTCCLIYYDLNFDLTIQKSSLEEIFFIALKLNDAVKSIMYDFNHIYTGYFDFISTGYKISYDKPDNNLIDTNYKFKIEKLKNKIDIINLSISFNEIEVIKNITCTINKGEMIAVCGMSSSGKSVFIKSLLGVYKYKGAIIYDEYEQKQIDEKSLLKNIAYIPQETFLFDLSIMENLKLGNPTIEDEKVIKLCKLFKLHGLFKELNYNKRVGSRGCLLSRGQRQKLIFMRALLKSASILLLDNAMSAMDIQSEKFFLELLKRYLSETTIITIVNNIKTLDTFDKIFYLEDGKLAAQGNLATLLSNSPQFSTFFKESLTLSNKF